MLCPPPTYKPRNASNYERRTKTSQRHVLIHLLHGWKCSKRAEDVGGRGGEARVTTRQARRRCLSVENDAAPVQSPAPPLTHHTRGVLDTAAMRDPTASAGVMSISDLLDGDAA